MNFLKLSSMILLCSLFFSDFNHAQSGNVEMKPMRDPQTGRVVSYLPLPTTWRMVTTANGTAGFEGPNGIKVSSLPTEVYYFNVDPYVAQMSGKTVANPVDLNTIFQQNIAPAIQQQGGRLIKQYPLQQIAQRSQQIMQGALSRARIQSYTMIASEWQQSNGHKSLILITQAIMHSQGGSTWTFGLTELEAPAQYFEKAKETYLYAQANWQLDRNTAMAHAAKLQQMDRESQQRLAQSAAAHNSRMRNNEAAFQATQRAHNSSFNDVSDMSMRGYWSRSDMQDRMRNKENNMIREEYTLTNPWDNRNMQVQSGYQNYYINSNGDVIGSNDVNFNPNVHRDYNGTQWKRMPKQNW
jgi:phage pi2 protein 07